MGSDSIDALSEEKLIPFHALRPQLPHIEHQGEALSIEARLKLRVEQSQPPALNALQQWLIQTRIKTANGGDSTKALDYTLRRWTLAVLDPLCGNQPFADR